MTSGPAPAPVDLVAVGAGQALFLYGVLRARDADRNVVLPAGLDGETARFVRAGQLAAVVTPMAIERPPGRRAELVSYQSLLDALAGHAPVAPVRFGTAVPDVSELVDDLLLPHHDRFVAALDRLEGRQQLNLRAAYLEEAVLTDLVNTDPEIRSLREYTRQLPESAGYRERARLGELVFRAMEERSAFDAEILLDAVAPLAVEHLVRTAPSATQVLDVALLVDEDRVAEMEERLEDLAEAVHERIRMRLLGPLAPYDFAGELGWD